MSTGNWVRTIDAGGTWMESLDGIDWGNGRVPRRWHRCRAQSRGHVQGDGMVERCNCGATRLGGDGPWIHRNETRTARKRQQREDALPRVTVTCRVCGNPYEAAEGSAQAGEELCNGCWADRLIAVHVRAGTRRR